MRRHELLVSKFFWCVCARCLNKPQTDADAEVFAKGVRRRHRARACALTPCVRRRAARVDVLLGGIKCRRSGTSCAGVYDGQEELAPGK